MVRSPRVVGIDYGTKRVGVALADPLRLFAQPYGTFSPDEALAALRKLHADEGIETLVIGWPRNPEGGEETALRLVQPFVHRVTRAMPDVRIVPWDELYTSHLAEQAIRSSGAGRKARRDKARIDAAAASIILQEYLDAASRG